MAIMADGIIVKRESATLPGNYKVIGVLQFRPSRCQPAPVPVRTSWARRARLGMGRLANPRRTFGFVSRRGAGALLRIAKPEGGIQIIALNAVFIPYARSKS